MNYRHLLSAAACVAALGLAGCSSNPSNAQIGTGVGAVAGGVLGSAVGGTAATVVAQRPVRSSATNWARIATSAAADHRTPFRTLPGAACAAPYSQPLAWQSPCERLLHGPCGIPATWPLARPDA